MKNKKFILGVIALLAVAVLLSAYFNFTKPKNLEVKEVSQNQIPVTLKVLDKTYVGQVKEGTSVYGAMQIFKENSSPSNPFTFVSKEYTGMGFFIEEINGIKGVPNKYWVYYINDQKSSVGASDYILKSGDVVSWKQEATL